MNIKSILLTTITLALSATTVHASLLVTSMYLGGDYAVEGSINDDGTFGEVNSIEPFFGQPWVAIQATAVITNSNGVAFDGLGVLGGYDYAADISLMTDNQIAVGIFWNWSTASNHPFLAVFDCVTTTGLCVGQTTGKDGVQFGGFQSGPFPGMIPTFNGTGALSAVPIPAAFWLFGSGLIVLVGFVRPKKV